MSIRTKTLTLISLTLIVLISALYAASHLILLRDYVTLENQNVERNVQRALNAVETKVTFFHNTSIDWAHWDDTYYFLLGENDGFIEENILDEVFDYYDLEFMLFLDNQGEVVFSQGFSRERQQQIPVSDSLTQFVSHNERLVSPRNAQGDIELDGIAGLVMLREQAFIMATTPVLTSDLEGEPAGVLVWGRTFDASLVHELASQTQLMISVNSIPANDAHLVPTLTNTSIAIQEISDSAIEGYTLLRDIHDDPALMLKIEMARSIYQQGQKSLSYFLLALVLVGVISAGAIGLMLEKVVLARLAYLNSRVSEIQVSNEISSRITMSGDDELASLSTSINAMLESLQAQEKIKLARDKAVEMAQMRGQILANLSHDARTPISVILLRSDMMMKGMYGALDERQQEVVRGITANAFQLMGFVNNMLEGVQLENGQLILDIGKVEPKRLLDTISMTLEPLALSKGLRLVTELHEDVPKTLCGDEKRLERILSNLVNNAIKFTPNGEIRVSLYRPDAAHWALEVKDTGVGISPEHQQHIFIPFWQVDGSHTRAADSGVGLGLSIVHQLTELMGGTVTVQSSKGAGSVFTVTLPLQPPTRATTMPT